MAANVMYMCQTYSAILTFKHVIGESLLTLRDTRPGCNYSLSYRRGKRPEHAGATAPMRIDLGGKVTWNLSKSFVCTISKSTYDGHPSQKVLDMSLVEHAPSGERRVVGQVAIDLCQYFKDAKFSKQYKFPLTVGTNGTCELFISIITEPMSGLMEDYRVDNDTTIGSEDDAYDTGAESQNYLSDNASQRSRSRSQPDPSAAGRSPAHPQQPFTQQLASTTPPSRLMGGATVSTVSSSAKAPSTIPGGPAPPPAQKLLKDNQLLQEDLKNSQRVTSKVVEEANQVLVENDTLQTKLRATLKLLEKERKKNVRLQPPQQGPCNCKNCVIS